jgi:hypothetical protein
MKKKDRSQTTQIEALDKLTQEKQHLSDEVDQLQ